MTHPQIRALLDDILHLSELIGGMNAQRTYKMYGPDDAIIEHGLRQALYEKKQNLLETVAENWQPNITLAAEVRRLREENEQLAGCVNKLKVERAWAIREAKRLTEENERLRADADRIDWLADVNNTVGSVVLPREIVEANVSSLRQAIDAARGAK